MKRSIGARTLILPTPVWVVGHIIRYHAEGAEAKPRDNIVTLPQQELGASLVYKLKPA